MRGLKLPPRDVAYLREQAEKCRSLAESVPCHTATANLRRLAEEFEAEALALHQKNNPPGANSRSAEA